MISTLSPGKILPGAHDGSLPHILLVLDQIPKTMGGGERIVLRMAALLGQYGYLVSILTFCAHPDSTALQSSPCPIYLLPLERTYDWTAFRGALDLRRFLKEKHIQIVQTFFESSDLWAGFVTKAMTNAKLIWSRRDMGILRSRKHSIAYRLMANLPDGVLTVSEQVRRHCIDVDGVDPDRVQTIYNGISLSDWSEIERTGPTRADMLISTVGNIRRVKGHDLFITAAAAIVSQFPEARFNIAGDVLELDYFLELQHLIQDLNLTSRFHFTGSVTNLREHLKASDIFVLPSRSEGFSNAILEAMAASLPVIATDVGGNAEAVTDGVNGFLVPPEDAPALAAAMTCLLSNPQQARAMGSAGRAIVREKFTSEVMMRQTVSAYKRALARH